MLLPPTELTRFNVWLFLELAALETFSEMSTDRSWALEFVPEIVFALLYVRFFDEEAVNLSFLALVLFSPRTPPFQFTQHFFGHNGG